MGSVTCYKQAATIIQRLSDWVVLPSDRWFQKSPKALHKIYRSNRQNINRLLEISCPWIDWKDCALQKKWADFWEKEKAQTSESTRKLSSGWEKI